MIRAPKSLNGYPVVRQRPHPNCATVMMKRDAGDYVIATWWPDLGDSWMWGHYLPDTTSLELDTEFRDVADRNATR